jgi:predicted histone-like DNA-binding protein
MSIKYKLVQHKNPQKPNDPPKFYARAITTDKINTKELCKDIADSSTVGVTDVYAVLMELRRLIPRRLAAGNAIEIEGLFDIYPMIVGDGADTEETFNVAEKINYVRVSVRPKKELREEVRNAAVEKAPWLSEEKPESTKKQSQ